MKTISCDFCGEKFSGTDNYIKAQIHISYTENLGDDGSRFANTTQDCCRACLVEITKALKKIEFSYLHKRMFGEHRGDNQ